MSKADAALHVLINGRRIGGLQPDKTGALRFSYDGDWLAAGRHPLSLSMPVERRDHGTEQTAAFFWGLLPDNAQILEGIARRSERGGPCSPNSLARMLAKVGMDCAGAVQVVREEDLIEAVEGGEEVVLRDAQIAEALRRLAIHPAPQRMVNHEGQFSLAGAQPKLAYRKTASGWAEPSGRIPTTHIFKPANPRFDGLVETEHVCMAAASRLGLQVAHSEIRYFEDVSVIVVERYDRIEGRRIHQEDMCQAAGIRPGRKYETDGGPGIDGILTLLAASSSPQEDHRRFVDALILNWLLLGTDAHAKNYSLLITDRQIRLAPLYDIASYYPFMGDHVPKLAMRIGRRRQQDHIRRQNWLQHGFKTDYLDERMHEMIAQLPDALADAIRACNAHGVRHPALAITLAKTGDFCKWAAAHYNLGLIGKDFPP
ncbi:HipA domain-containing protein [Ferrovibrio sp.]|uniref:HipA domain-containing protein n=1 Tax=Ferrovibrio sp. TaxID=1917215 RepID=UPI0035AE8B4C